METSELSHNSNRYVHSNGMAELLCTLKKDFGSEYSSHHHVALKECFQIQSLLKARCQL